MWCTCIIYSALCYKRASDYFSPLDLSEAIAADEQPSHRQGASEDPLWPTSRGDDSPRAVLHRTHHSHYGLGTQADNRKCLHDCKCASFEVLIAVQTSAFEHPAFEMGSQYVYYTYCE